VTLRPVTPELDHTREDGWWRWIRWRTEVGIVELWRRDDVRPQDGPVRVTGDVPAAHSALEPFDWMRWFNRRRTDAERRLVEGLTVEVEGHDVVLRMPTRGWSRDSRRIFITVDGAEYVARPRAIASTQLARPDGTPIWRSSFWGDDRLADDATPVEVTIAALCRVADLHSRMVRNPIHAI
jgi:hypothetical protein